jgi:hypothetical protein
MKTKSLLFVIIILLSFSCSENSDEPKAGKMSFSLKSNDRGSNGERVEGLDNATKVFVSVETTNGTVVKDLAELTLLHVGDDFVSQNIELLPGSYKLTKFIVTDDSNTALYVTPIENSDLASLVSDPLPVDFSIADKETTTLALEVVSTDEEEPTTPDSFGYSQLNLTAKKFAALKLPNIQGIQKISYMFTKGTEEMVKGDVTPTSPIINLNNAELPGSGEWQGRIYIYWEQGPGDCYQRVDRFKGGFTFNDKVIALQSFQDSRWDHLLLSEGTYNNVPYKLLRSADPRNTYHVEFQGLNIYHIGFVDRSFVDTYGELLCESEFLEWGPAVNGIMEVTFPVAGVCPATESDYGIDSFIYFGSLGSNNYFALFFIWSVNDGVISYCEPDNGRVKTASVRRTKSTDIE